MRAVLDAGCAARAPGARSSSRRPACAPAATAGTASSPSRTSRASADDGARGARLRPADRGRPARLAARASAAPCSRRRSRPRGLAPRPDRCASRQGAGVVLRPWTTAVARRSRLDALAPRAFLRLALASCAGALPRRDLGRVRAPDRLRASAARTGRAAATSRTPSRASTRSSSSGTALVALVGARADARHLARGRARSPGCRAACGSPRSPRSCVTVAQIPMGAITIAVDLHPLAVMTHFLLALVVLALAVVVAVEALRLRGRRRSRRPARVAAASS